MPPCVCVDHQGCNIRFKGKDDTVVVLGVDLHGWKALELMAPLSHECRRWTYKTSPARVGSPGMALV